MTAEGDCQGYDSGVGRWGKDGGVGGGGSSDLMWPETIFDRENAQGNQRRH